MQTMATASSTSLNGSSSSSSDPSFSYSALDADFTPPHTYGPNSGNDDGASPSSPLNTLPGRGGGPNPDLDLDLDLPACCADDLLCQWLRRRAFLRALTVDVLYIALQSWCLYLAYDHVGLATAVAALVYIAGLAWIGVFAGLPPWLFHAHLHLMTFMYISVIYTGPAFIVDRHTYTNISSSSSAAAAAAAAAELAFFLARASRPFTLFSSLASASTSFASSYLLSLAVLIISVTVARLC